MRAAPADTAKLQGDMIEQEVRRGPLSRIHRQQGVRMPMDRHLGGRSSLCVRARVLWRRPVGDSRPAGGKAVG